MIMSFQKTLSCCGVYGIEKKTFCGDDVGWACCSRAAGGGGPFTYGKAVP